MLSKRCSRLRRSYQIGKESDRPTLRKSHTGTFIADKQQLESVIGQSSLTWFEDLTARQTCEKQLNIEHSPSMIVSPVSSVTLSQLIMDDLEVGISPQPLHTQTSSPPCMSDSYLHCTPKSKKACRWSQPHISLGPSPTSAILFPVSTFGILDIPNIAVDDSSLCWSNSFATPPKEASNTEHKAEVDIPEHSTNVAKVLPSPISELNSTVESLAPLDGTLERTFDIETENQSNKSVVQRLVFESKMDSEQNCQLLRSTSMKSEHLKEECTEDKITEIEELADIDSDAEDKLIAIDSDSVNLERNLSESVDEVLSDFFSSFEKNKPAPRKKHKSVEFEDDVPKYSLVEDSGFFTGSGFKCSTPNNSFLHSILLSNRKRNSSSLKKVRFSDSVQECSYDSNQTSVIKSCRDVENEKKMCLHKKVKFEQDVFRDDEFRNELVYDYGTKATSEEVNLVEKINVELESLTEVKSEVLQSMNNTEGLKSKYLSNEDEVTMATNPGFKYTETDMVETKSRLQKADDVFSEELFSQVSPSALTEMCSVAEKFINCSQNIVNDCMTDEQKQSVKNMSESLTQLCFKTTKRFCFSYPSRSNLAMMTRKKVFQYEDSLENMPVKKGLLTSINIKDMVDNRCSEHISHSFEAKTVGHETNSKKLGGETEPTVEGTMVVTTSSQPLLSSGDRKVSMDCLTQFVSVDESPASVHESPASVHESPASVHESPASVHESPASVHESPASVHESPASVHESPASVHESPASVHESPASVHESPASAIKTLMYLTDVECITDISEFLRLKKLLKSSQSSEQQMMEHSGQLQATSSILLNKENCLPLKAQETSVKDFFNSHPATVNKLDTLAGDNDLFSVMLPTNNAPFDATLVGFCCASGRKLEIATSSLSKAAKLLHNEVLKFNSELTDNGEITKAEKEIIIHGKSGINKFDECYVAVEDMSVGDLEVCEWPDEEFEPDCFENVAEMPSKQVNLRGDPPFVSTEVSRNILESVDFKMEPVNFIKENEPWNEGSGFKQSDTMTENEMEDQKYDGNKIVNVHIPLIDNAAVKPSAIVEAVNIKKCFTGMSDISQNELRQNVPKVKHVKQESAVGSLKYEINADEHVSLESELVALKDIKAKLKSQNNSSEYIPVADTQCKSVTMKTTAHNKFPPGAIIPQGFRPFKPPRMLSSSCSKINRYPASKSKVCEGNTYKTESNSSDSLGIKCQSVGNKLQETGTVTKPLECNTNSDKNAHLLGNFDNFQGISQMFEEDMESTQPVEMKLNSIECMKLETIHDCFHGQSHITPVLLNLDISAASHKQDDSQGNALLENISLKEIQYLNSLKNLKESTLNVHSMMDARDSDTFFHTSSDNKLSVSLEAVENINEPIHFENDDSSGTSIHFMKSSFIVKNTNKSGKSLVSTNVSIQESDKCSLNYGDGEAFISAGGDGCGFMPTIHEVISPSGIRTKLTAKHTDEKFELGETEVKDIQPIKQNAFTNISSFSTADGKVVKVSEKASKNINTSVLNNELISNDGGDDLDRSDGGIVPVLNDLGITEWCIENDDSIFKEESHHQLCLNIEENRSEAEDIPKNELQDEFKMPVLCGFTTAGGRKVLISDEALKLARVTIEGTNTDGDLNATNKNLSDARLHNARNTLQEVHERNVTGCKNNELQLRNPNKDTAFYDSGTTSERNVMNSKSFVKQVCKSVDKTYDEVNQCKENASENGTANPVLSGFSTASGKGVKINKDSLKRARVALEMNSDLNIECENPLNRNEVSENTVQINEESFMKHVCKSVDETCDEVHECKENSSENRTVKPVFSGFSTASGKGVKINEESLKHARNALEITRDLNIDCENPLKRNDISEKTVKVNEESFVKQVCKSFDKTCDEIHKCKENASENRTAEPVFSGFSTASGKGVEINEEHFVKQICKCVDKTCDEIHECKENASENITVKPVFRGFSTASGKGVKINEESLKHARNTLEKNSDLNIACENQSNRNDISGKTVKRNEESFLKQICKSFDKVSDNVNKCKEIASENRTVNPVFSGFSTASGKGVKINEEALKHARIALEMNSDLNIECENPSNRNEVFGKTVKRNEETFLKQICKSFDKTCDDLNKCKENASENRTAKVVFSGFSTASGKGVEINEESFVKQVCKSVDKKCDEVNECTENTPENISVKPAFSGFSTASGKGVEINEESLKRARIALEMARVLNIECENPSKRNDISEKTVKVNEESFVKHVHKSVDIMCDEVNQCKENALEHRIAKPVFSGFSTASGKGVKINEESLKHARNALEMNSDLNIECENPSKRNEVSGKTVKINEESLPHALKIKSHQERDCEHPSKGNEVIEDHNIKLTVDKTSNYQYISVNKAVVGNMMSGAIATGSGKKVQFAEDAIDIVNKVQDVTKHVDNKCTSGNEIVEHEIPECVNTSELPLKRQRIASDEDRSMETTAVARKPLKSGPEGITTDRRHSGYRPFIPVSSYSLDKAAKRPGSLLLDYLPDIKKKTTPSSRPAFHTPYNTIMKDTLRESIANATVTSKTPVFRTKTKLTDEDRKCVFEPAQLGNNDLLSTSVEYNGIDRNIDKHPGNVTSFINEKPDFHESTTGMSYKEDKTNKPGNAYLTGSLKRTVDSNVPTNLSPLDTLTSLDKCSMDIFSEDDSDMFYFNLVKARFYQQEIISSNNGKMILPAVGRLFKMKQFGIRLKLRDVIDKVKQGIVKSSPVTSKTAAGYQFLMSLYYSKDSTHVLVGDGAYLVPDDAGMVGKEEFYRAFLTIDGVDKQYVNEAWVFNHYRWIVWKLAAYEVTSTSLSGRSLTPEMVMLQLKYRYDREIDMAHRSALKKIYERDDTSGKRLVLCVADVIHSNIDTGNQDSTVTLPSQIQLELTDGWYRVLAQIDGPLMEHVRSGKIFVGQKLCISGAELTGEACSPLDVASSVILKIYANSTRAAPWDSQLGYHMDPRPLCVPLCSLYAEGGTVGVVDVVIARKYPIMFMEKLQVGGTVFRTGRCEDKARQEYESYKQSMMEQLYREMETNLEKQDKKERKSSSCMKFTRTEIEQFQSGEEIHEALEKSAQPDLLQNYLSDSQMCMLYEYQRQIRDQQQFQLNTEVQRVWQEKLEAFPARNVIPVLKFRVAGCSHKDIDKKISTTLMVWRPASEILDIQEGKRYKMYSLNTSASRSKYTGHHVQLIATNQTRYRLMTIEENFLDNIYERREVLYVRDVRRHQPPYGELDFVGIIVLVLSASQQNGESGRTCDTIYLADCHMGILAVRFWNGFKSFGEDLFEAGKVFCCSNLMDKASYRSPFIPTVEAASEYSQLSNKPQNGDQRQALDKLNAVLKDNHHFLEEAQLMVQNTLQGTKKQYAHEKSYSETTNNSREVNIIEDKNYDDIEKTKNAMTTSNMDKTTNKTLSDISSDKVLGTKTQPGCSDNRPLGTMSSALEKRRSVVQAKMAKLATYSAPSALTPLNSTVSKSVQKAFKPPSGKKL